MEKVSPEQIQYVVWPLDSGGAVSYLIYFCCVLFSLLSLFSNIFLIYLFFLTLCCCKKLNFPSVGLIKSNYLSILGLPLPLALLK